jgi:pimeloyl-ACP methyl ester carboxylesterase
MTDTIVLLHGVNGAREEMAPLAALLPPSLAPLAPNWLGHGGRPPPGPDYSVGALVDDLIAKLDGEGIHRCFLFGYSIGGYLALALAHRNPERVRGVVTLATRHIWDRESVDHLVYLADPARLTRPGNPRAAELARVHHPTDWQLVNGANRRMFADLRTNPPLGDDDLRAISAPVLVLNGTDDPLVSADESRALAALFRTWRLGLFEGSAHPLPATPIADIAAAIADFARDVAAAERV